MKMQLMHFHEQTKPHEWKNWHEMLAKHETLKRKFFNSLCGMPVYMLIQQRQIWKNNRPFKDIEETNKNERNRRKMTPVKITPSRQ